MGGSTSARGALSEMVAIPWLMKQGFNVFRSLSYNNPVDLVAIDSNFVTILIDVTTIHRSNHKGTNYKWQGKKQTPTQLERNIKILYVHPETGDCSWDVATFNREDLHEKVV